MCIHAHIICINSHYVYGKILYLRSKHIEGSKECYLLGGGGGGGGGGSKECYLLGEKHNLQIFILLSTGLENNRQVI